MKHIVKISVVIPTLNEEKYLTKTLASLFSQTFKDFEVIVSDGGSTDGTTVIAKKYVNKLIVKKGSVCVGRQLGLEAASGEIIVGADADTIYPEDYLERIWDIFSQRDDVLALCGPVKFINSPIWAHAHMRLAKYYIEIIYRMSGKVVYAFALNLAYRKDALTKLGGYNTSLDFGGDELDIIERLQKAGKMLYIRDLPVISDGRRFRVGFLKYYIKYIFWGYLLNYFVRKYLKLNFITSEPVR